MLRIEIETGNAAFQDGGDGPAEECIFILSRISSALRAGHVEGGCMDSNGNRVGKWELTAHD